MKILLIYTNVIGKIKYFSNESGAGCWYRKESTNIEDFPIICPPDDMVDELCRPSQ